MKAGEFYSYAGLKVNAIAEDYKLDPVYHVPQRVLLYHIYVMLDVNGCQLKYIDLHTLSREADIQVPRHAVFREVMELDSSNCALTNERDNFFGMTYDGMRKVLIRKGCREPETAL